MVLILQILMLIVILGVIYSLWQTTRAYGGLIGGALKWIGVGIVFFTIEAFDRVFGALGSFSIVSSLPFAQPALVHNAILLLGLVFSGLGFSKLTKIAKP